MSKAGRQNSSSQPAGDENHQVAARPSTLFEICDSSFVRRKANKRKRKNEDPSNPAVAQAAKKSSDKKNPAVVPQKRPENYNESRAGPRVEIVNGKIVVKESSLVLQYNQLVEDEYEEIVEGVHSSATYSSFLRKRSSPPWGIEETRLFYKAIRQCGTDFSLMMAFFPGRTRKQLKLKFFREEKQHPELVKVALNTSLPLALAPFDLQPTPKLQAGNIVFTQTPLQGDPSTFDKPIPADEQQDDADAGVEDPDDNIIDV